MNRAPSLVGSVLGFISLIVITGCGGGNSATVAPPATSVSVSADSTSVAAGGSASLTAVVSQDSTGKGVTWKVSCSAAQCGSVSPTATASGVSTTYTAPTTPPASDVTVTITATSVADTSKSGSTTIVFSAISVSVSPATAVVQAGGVVTLSPTVNNDLSGQGVSWTISPASGSGTLTNVSSAVATYKAPANPPAADITVSVTAKSVADPSKSAVVTLTVPSVFISVTPTTSSIPAGGKVPNVTAVLGNDPSHQGVTWTISCPAAPCGAISPTATASGVATVYTAPPTPPSADLPITVTATSVADPAAATSITITVLAISVSVTPASASVAFADSVPNIVATVSNDPAGGGVTWSIQACAASPCGSLSASSAPSGGAITYTAPSTPVPNDLTVALVATSVSDTSKSNSVAMTVLAITVSISPQSGMVPVNAAPQLNATPFTATVGNDSSNQGVSWTLTQGTPPTSCSPTCGTLSAATTANTPTTYSAPNALPTPAAVTLTGASIADPSKTATATITLIAGAVKIIPGTLDFGGLKLVNKPKKSLTATLTNAGSSVLSISNQSTSSPYSVATPCPASVASGISCGIVVAFAPTSTGTFNSNLTITDSDTSSPQQLPLTGSACNSRACFAGSIKANLVSDRVLSVPSPTGSNKVGTREMDLLDHSRTDPYLSNGKKRELLVRFWYPTATQTCKPAAYASSAVWNYMAQMLRVAPPQVQTNSCANAPIKSGSHPVVVFTHGYSGTLTDYTFLFEDLASKGYVVASVGHTFESTAIEFPDGRLAKSVLGSHLDKQLRMADSSTSFAVAVRLSDLKFVMDELGRLNTRTASPFAGALDMSRTALAGHSLGGMTALLGVELDPRFRAAISLDGVLPGALFSPTNTPTLMLLAGSEWDSKSCKIWNSLQGPRFALNLKGSEHITPSDAIWLTHGAIKTSGGMEKTVAAVRKYIAAFLDTNLNGKPMDELLTGASPDFPEIEVTTQGQAGCGKAGAGTRK